MALQTTGFENGLNVFREGDWRLSGSERQSHSNGAGNEDATHGVYCSLGGSYHVLRAPAYLIITKGCALEIPRRGCRGTLRLLAAWRLCVIIVFQSVHDSRDAVFNQCYVEVDQQAKPLVGETEIGQKLLLVDWGEQLDGFDFHDDLFLDHQIGPESGIDADTVIDHRNRLLAHCAEAPPAQLIRQDCLINGFQQARTQGRMNAESGVD